MQSSSESFWSEIKKLEERLQREPSSFCFAPLADAYLKAGMIDDALAVAKAGVTLHPGYVAGQMALARVCQHKGVTDECQKALEVVTAAVPEHAEAQQMLAKLYRESGRADDAVRALRTLLELSQDDAHTVAELELLIHQVEDDDLELIEFTEDDIVEDDEATDQLVVRIKPAAALVVDPWAGISVDHEASVSSEEMLDAASLWALPEQQLAADAAEEADDTELDEDSDRAGLEMSVDGADPLVTPTLAELYVTQGFPEKAVEIYRKILATDPSNTEALQRISSLGQQPVESGPEAAQAQEVSEFVPVASAGVMTADLPSQGEADGAKAVLPVLEGWLENIRRLRACR